MTKESFIKHMCVLKTLYDNYESLFGRLYELNIDIGSAEYFYKIFEEDVRTLTEVVGGENAIKIDPIGYYIYELDWGKSLDKCFQIKTDDGLKNFPLNNYSELYDCLLYFNDAEVIYEQ